MLKIAVLLTAVDKMTDVINKATNSATARLDAFSKRANKMGDAAFGVGQQAGLMGLAAGAALYDLAKQAEASATANARLEQVFKSMGETTGVAAEKAREYAKSLMFEIAVDDEQILAVQAKLATFENVIKNATGSSEIFERATKAAFDLAAAGFGEGTQNAVQLGKALQDPIKGMTALARSGVTFTAVEKAKIAAMVQSGKLFEAQQYLLAAVEKQVGGVAAATANDSDKITIALGEIREAVGVFLLPTLNKLTNFLTGTAIPAFDKLTKEHGPLIEKALLAVAAFAGLSLAVSAGAFIFGAFMKVLSFGATTIGYVIKAFQFLGVAIRAVTMFMISNPIVAIIVGIAAAALLIYVYWDEIKAFFIRLWDNVKIIFAKTWEWLKNLFLNYTPHGLIYKNWDKITAWFAGLWEKVKAIFFATWDWIKNLFLNYTPHGLIIQHWGKIVDWFGELWNDVKTIFSGWVDWVLGLGNEFRNAGANIINSLWEGMKSMANKPVEAMKEIVGSIREYLPFSPAKVGPLKDIHRIRLVETIADSMKPTAMLDSMQRVSQAVFNFQPTGGAAPAPALAMAGGGGGGVTVQMNINVAGGATAGAATAFIDELRRNKDEIARIVRDALSDKQRRSFG